MDDQERTDPIAPRVQLDEARRGEGVQQVRQRRLEGVISVRLAMLPVATSSRRRG